MEYKLGKIFSNIKIFSSEVSDGPMNFDLPEGQKNIEKFLIKNKITRPLVTCSQPHRTEIAIAQKPGRILGADGVLTTKDFALGVKTADCVPLMLFEPKSGLIGAIHVSRKNLLAGIVSESLNNVLAQLQTPNSKHPTPNTQLLVFLGPHIRLQNYPIKQGQVAKIENNPIGRKFLRKIDDKNYFDMTASTYFELEKIGILAENVFDSGIDTFAANEFFSSRRAEANSPVKLSITVIFKS